MYPFPPKRDIDFLVGETLETITMAGYTLHFAFDGLCSVTEELAVTFIQNNGTTARYDIQDFPNSPPVTFHSCIGKKVIDLEAEELRLRLKFDNGDIIQFESQEGPYESGQITRDAQSGKEPLFIVF